MTSIMQTAREVIALEDDGSLATWDLYAEAAHPLARTVVELEKTTKLVRSKIDVALTLMLRREHMDVGAEVEKILRNALRLIDAEKGGG